MPLTRSHQNLKTLAEESFKKYSSSLFLTNVGEAGISYEKAQVMVSNVQAMLKALEIKPGDKVAICSENMPTWGIAYIAISTMGAVVVPILADFHNNEIHHIIKHSEAKAMFVSNKLFSKINEDDFSSNLSYVFSLENFELIETKTPSHSEFYNKGMKTLTELKKKALHFASDKKIIKINHVDTDLNIQSDDIAAIIYTSGTTGQSKGVMLSHGNITAQIQQAKTLIEISKDDRFLSILPLAHTFECSLGLLVPLANGSSIHYLNRVPSPKIILKAMKTVKPTCMLSVPLVIEKIYKNKVLPEFQKNFVIKYLYKHVPFIRKILNNIAGKKLIESFGGEIKFFGIGGAKLSEFVEAFLLEANFPYAIGYGLTETAPIIAGAIPGKTRLGTTGILAAGVEARFIKQNESDLSGELHVRGPNIMAGYYRDQQQTNDVIDNDGWFNTGDLGYIDKHGILTINGRSKNVIIGANGENIYPECVEAIINQHQFVIDSLVYEQDNQVVAKIHIDYDLFDEEYKMEESNEAELHKDIIKLLASIKESSNMLLSANSKLKMVIEQTEPFIKTPTKKIKRYLYT